MPKSKAELAADARERRLEPRAKLTKKYEVLSNGNIYSMSGGELYTVHVELSRVESVTHGRPHYE